MIFHVYLIDVGPVDGALIHRGAVYIYVAFVARIAAIIIIAPVIPVIVVAMVIIPAFDVNGIVPIITGASATVTVMDGLGFASRNENSNGGNENG